MLKIDDMNPPQREAVVTTDGPVLVLAGAGSGKTRVLTYRIAYILDAGLARAGNILAMTFTNKAAEEMKKRIEVILKDTHLAKGRDEDVSLFWTGTFHSICVKILKRYGELVGLSKNFVIYDSSDQLMAIKEAMNRAKVSVKEFNPHALHSYISSAKNELIDADAYKGFAQGYFQQVVAQIYPKYQDVLKENNAVDFDDLLFFTVKLLQKNKEILEKLQNNFRYILVDEYQDTNHAQYTIVKMLADKHRNICCVGDDDQSIYAFRGATIKNILNFEKDYPEAKVIKLEQNYRSTKKILEASYHVISKNKRRKEKKLWTENMDGENITIYKAYDEINEAGWLIERINELKLSGVDYPEIAILYRTNAQSRSLEEAFLQSGVPYKIVGGVRFYERKEVKDILAYLRLIYNIKDNNSLQRIINVPRRGIGGKTLSDLIQQAALQEMSGAEYILQERDKLPNTKIKGFYELLQQLISISAEKNIVDLIQSVLEKTKYIEMLDDGTSEGESRIENIKELISVASKYESDTPRAALEQFLDEVALLESYTANRDNPDTVTLMTIHAAKGLEFEHVFVVGMEESLFPHSNSMMDGKEMEEERRLAYVAITRAKFKLYLTYAAKRKYFGKTQKNLVSRFIDDIPAELVDKINDEAIGSDLYDNYGTLTDSNDYEYKVDLNVGDKVKHEYFGKGVVKRIDSDMIVVDFGPVYGTKELMAEYAKLERI